MKFNWNRSIVELNPTDNNLGGDSECNWLAFIILSSDSQYIAIHPTTSAKILIAVLHEIPFETGGGNNCWCAL